MTVPSETRIEEYACNNSVVDFDYEHGFFVEADLVVNLHEIATGDDTLLELGVDYTISTVNNNFKTGASVTTVATYTALYEIHIERTLEITQETVWPPTGDFSPKAQEDAVDRLTMIDQQQQDELGHAIHDNVPSEFDVIPEKTSSVSGDKFLSEDSEDTGAKKWVDADNMPNSNSAAVTLNTTHRTSDGEDHSDVVLNNAHRVDTANPHATDIENLGAGTLAELNSAVSDATLIDTGDARLSDTRDPNNHASEHTDGTDDIQSATGAVKGLLTSATQTIGGAKTFNNNINLVADLLFDNAGDLVLDSSVNDFRFYENANLLMTVKGDDAGVNVASTTVSSSPTTGSFVTGGGIGCGQFVYALSGFVCSVDSARIYFGGGADASVHYDGTNMLLSPQVQGSGVIRVVATTYEGSVLDDDDIPNKKYVDDAIIAGGPATYTDYLATSTIAGWTTPSGYIYYRQVGKEVAVWFFITGTSNAVTCSFTLPFACNSNAKATGAMGAGNRDNSALLTTGCSYVVTAGTSACQLSQDMGGTVAWTGSGTKTVSGWFIYYTD